MTTCATCKHWLPRETPQWAQRLRMACCAIRNSKAFTTSANYSCASASPADAATVQRRAVWLGGARIQSATKEEIT